MTPKSWIEARLSNTRAVALGATIFVGVAHCGPDQPGAVAQPADAGAETDGAALPSTDAGSTGRGESDAAVTFDAGFDAGTDSGSCSAQALGCRPGEACQEGACVLACPAGQTVCGSVCSSTETDVANCGKCGRSCDVGLVCAHGECAASCGDLASCGTACADMRNDPANCGGCGRRCPGAANSIAVCVAERCATVCAPGFEDCNHDAADGCEANLSTSVDSCGACGRACPATDANHGACVNGTCALGPCADGYEDCDGNPANGCETNVQWGNGGVCGACGRRCSLPNTLVPYCNNFWCTVGQCQPGYGRCRGPEENGCDTRLDTDAACGDCWTQCTGGMRCMPVPDMADAYACKCPSGLTTCNGACVDISVNAAHCNGCDQSCASANATDARCVAGACTLGRCTAEHDDCDRRTTNGCEAHLTHDRKNCGACGRTCAAGERCAAGACIAATPCTVKSAPTVLVYHHAPNKFDADELPRDALVSFANWTTLSTADFAKYDLIVIPYDGCDPYGPGAVNAARDVWSPAITGRIVVSALSSSDTDVAPLRAVRKASFSWLTSAPGTALFVQSNCGNHSLDHLSAFGSFSFSYDPAGGGAVITEPNHPVVALAPPLGTSSATGAFRAPSDFDTLAAVKGTGASLIAVRDVACAGP